jgi:hypothetical protein
MGDNKRIVLQKRLRRKSLAALVDEDSPVFVLVEA